MRPRRYILDYISAAIKSGLRPVDTGSEAVNKAVKITAPILALASISWLYIGESIIGLTLASLYVASIFVVGPFLAWRTERKRVEELEDAAKPSMEILFDDSEIDLGDGEAVGNRWKIGVKNTGGHALEACKVRIEFTDGITPGAPAYFVSAPFSLALRETHIVTLFRVGIQGAAWQDARLVTYYVAPGSSELTGLPSEHKPGNYEILVEVLAANSMPAQKRLRVMHDKGKWRVEKALNHPPAAATGIR